MFKRIRVMYWCLTSLKFHKQIGNEIHHLCNADYIADTFVQIRHCFANAMFQWANNDWQFCI